MRAILRMLEPGRICAAGSFVAAGLRAFRLVAAALAVAIWALAAPGPADAQLRGAAPIREVIVDGNQRIESSTIQSYLTMASGDLYTEEQADKSLKALFATGLFADVNIRMQGGSLLVRVTENPVINRLLFEGNRRISDDTLRKELTLKPRQVYTRTKVQADTQRIQQIYRRSGRFGATVEPKVIQLPQNRVDLVFEIAEGGLTTVSRIRFIGNKAFSDTRLREEIQTKETRFYRILSSDDNYDPDRVTFDREKLRKFYLSKGYADFNVLNAVAELAPDRESFYITFSVEEGVRYRFGAVDVISEIKNVDIGQLKSLVTTTTGDTYNADAVEKVVQSLTSELGKYGYAFVDVRPEVNKDRDRRTIGVTYVVNESPRVFVERIDITGNLRTLDKVVRREFRLVEGDAFNAAKLRRTRTRIRALNFFEKAEITEAKGSAPDKVILTAEVTEKSTGELSFGFGFSTTESVLGDVSIRERNLLGRGQDLKLGFSISSRRQQIDLGFTEPYFLDRELAAGFDLVRRSSDFRRRSGVKQTTTGATLRAGYPITENLSQLVYYRIRQDEIDDIETTSRVLRLEEGSFVTSAIGQTLTYDRRDDKIDPTEGYVLRMTNEVAGLAGTERYLKNVLQGAHYFPVSDDVVLTVGGEGGYVYGFSDRLRLVNRFFLGGDTFRGFRTGGVGPHETTTNKAIGGDTYYKGDVELTFPIGLPNDFGIKGRLFSEVGTLYGTEDTGPDVRDAKSLRASAGAGLSWKSPFGLIRVDVGFPLRKEDFDQTEMFRVNFGSRF